MAQIQIVIVTPETTTFDKMVDSAIVPLIDGEAGLMPGHAAMIGRLGPGEVRAVSGSSQDRFYVDGGFVQVEGDVISVLTGQSMPVSELDLDAARASLETAEQQPAETIALMAIKEKAVSQARAQIRIAEKL